MNFRFRSAFTASPGPRHDSASVSGSAYGATSTSAASPSASGTPPQSPSDQCRQPNKLQKSRESQSMRGELENLWRKVSSRVLRRKSEDSYAPVRQLSSASGYRQPAVTPTATTAADVRLPWPWRSEHEAQPRAALRGQPLGGLTRIESLVEAEHDLKRRQHRWLTRMAHIVFEPQSGTEAALQRQAIPKRAPSRQGRPEVARFEPRANIPTYPQELDGRPVHRAMPAPAQAQTQKQAQAHATPPPRQHHPGGRPGQAATMAGTGGHRHAPGLKTDQGFAPFAPIYFGTPLSMPDPADFLPPRKRPQGGMPPGFLPTSAQSRQPPPLQMPLHQPRYQALRIPPPMNMPISAPPPALGQRTPMPMPVSKHTPAHVPMPMAGQGPMQMLPAHQQTVPPGLPVQVRQRLPASDLFERRPELFYLDLTTGRFMLRPVGPVGMAAAVPPRPAKHPVSADAPDMLDPRVMLQVHQQAIVAQLAEIDRARTIERGYAIDRSAWRPPLPAKRVYAPPGLRLDTTFSGLSPVRGPVHVPVHAYPSPASTVSTATSPVWSSARTGASTSSKSSTGTGSTSNANPSPMSPGGIGSRIEKPQDVFRRAQDRPAYTPRTPVNGEMDTGEPWNVARSARRK